MATRFSKPAPTFRDTLAGDLYEWCYKQNEGEKEMSPLIAPPPPERDEWQNPPEGVHQGVVYKKPESIGKVVDKWHPEGVEKVEIAWQLNPETAGMCEYTYEGKKKSGPFIVKKRYNFSMFKNDKGTKSSTLCKDVEAMRGRFDSPREASRFDLESLEGANGLLNVVLNPDATDPEKIWANVDNVMPLPKGTTPMKPVEPKTTDDSLPF